MPWSNDLDKKIEKSKETKQDSKNVWKDLDSEIEKGKHVSRMKSFVLYIVLLLFACGFFWFIVEMIRIGAGK